jgi:hypothetical protein
MNAIRASGGRRCNVPCYPPQHHYYAYQIFAFISNMITQTSTRTLNTNNKKSSCLSYPPPSTHTHIWAPCLIPSTGAITSSYRTGNLRNISRCQSLRVLCVTEVCIDFQCVRLETQHLAQILFKDSITRTYTSQRETYHYTILLCGCHAEAEMKVA